jgi:hypothetical protein
VVRGAILTESSADADAVIRQLAERFPVFDKGLAVTSSGYVDHKVLVRFPDGQVAEVQVAPRAVFRASESIGHVWYDQQRAMLVNKRVPAERMAEYLALEARQIALYSEALAETPGWLDAALAAAPPTVSQALNRSRQATGSMAAALESTTATSTSTQGLPGEGMTNAARSPSTSPVTAGRSSSAPNERADFTGSSTTESVAQVERVKRWLAPDLKALEPIIRVNVVYSTEELPDPNAPPDVEGAYTQDGEVWFVARNIPTEKRAREVGRHEVFGHMAIERNGEFKARLAAIERAIRAGNFRDLVREVRRRQGLLPAVIEAREVVALMAERGIQSPLLGSLRTALRKVGRDLGLDMPLDEGELNALVAVAARDLRHDAAIMQDFRAAQGLPAVKALEKADPTELEILSAIDAIYDDDALDHDYRRAPSGKRVEPGGQMYHQRAYHGSAHEFPRFSLDHIGKGEGAQSYGWGLYFTSQKEIAEHYRNKLSPRPTVTVGGREVVLDFYLFDRSLAPERIEQIVAKRLALLQKAEAELGHPLPVQELIQTVEKDLQRSIKMAIATDDSVVLQSVQKQLATLKDMVAAGLDVKTHGKVYEVEIPEDHTLADYDKLLENQPPKVRRALREVAKAAPTTTSNYGGGGSPERLLAMLDDPTLQATFERFLMVLSDAYADTKREPGTSGNPADRAAALALREAGVLGHKYKGHGSGVPNFVIYDDGVIETKAMYSRRGGQDQDLFGDDRKTEQEIADEQRRRDERRSPNRDVNADTGDPNDLFTTRRQQMLFSRSGKPTTTKAFKAWFGKSKVVDEDGKPRVVYHGTTGDFDTFDPAKATTESDLGAGLYFTSERRDVQHNYAGFGPDLTARLERRAEDIASSYGYDGAIGNDLKNELGLADNETPEDRTTEEVTAAAMAIARRQLASQNDGFTMPVYLKIENPLVIGNSHERGLDETFLEYNWPRDEEGEPTGEPDTGTLVDFLDGLSAVASRYDGGDVDDLRSRILELGLDGGIKASVIFDLAKSTEQFNYFQDESGNLVSNEILRQAFEHAGFDGIIDYTVDKKFGSQRRVGRSMEGMDEDTVHYVAFRPEQVKSAIGNSGAFDPNNPSILMSRAAAIPGSVPNDITEMLERLMAKPNEAVTIKDRAREQWRKLTGFNVDAIRQGVIDSFDAVKQLEKGQAGALLDAAESPYKAALATKNLPSVMAAVMMRGVPVYKDGAFQLEAGRKGVIEIFQPLTEHPDGNLLPLWELYAAAKRAKQLKKEGREKLFSDEDIRKAEALAQQYPILEEVAKDWEAFNNQLLDLAVERGVLDPVAVKAWRQNFYVPFYRAMEEAGSEGPKTRRARQEAAAGVRKAARARVREPAHEHGVSHRRELQEHGHAEDRRDGRRRGHGEDPAQLGSGAAPRRAARESARPDGRLGHEPARHSPRRGDASRRPDSRTRLARRAFQRRARGVAEAVPPRGARRQGRRQGVRERQAGLLPRDRRPAAALDRQHGLRQLRRRVGLVPRIQAPAHRRHYARPRLHDGELGAGYALGLGHVRRRHQARHRLTPGCQGRVLDGLRGARDDGRGWGRRRGLRHAAGGAALVLGRQARLEVRGRALHGHDCQPEKLAQGMAQDRQRRREREPRGHLSGGQEGRRLGRRGRLPSPRRAELHHVGRLRRDALVDRHGAVHERPDPGALPALPRRAGQPRRLRHEGLGTYGRHAGAAPAQQRRGGVRAAAGVGQGHVLALLARRRALPAAQTVRGGRDLRHVA